MPSSFRVTRIPLIAGMCFFAVAVIAEYAAILVLNDGFFTYTLDDAYIHLALAENILRGHYGISMGELCAPSSSILWPFLVAPFSAWESFPLVLNVLCGALTVLVFAKILEKSIRDDTGAGALVRTAVLIALILGTNLVWLVFVGMEHSLQVLLVSLIVYGLIVETEDGRVAPWLVAAIVAAPLVRYEDLAVSIAAIGFLVVRRHVKSSVTAFAVIAVLIGGFSLFLVHIGFSPFPASVAAKSSVVRTGGSLGAIYENLVDTVTLARGVEVCAFFTGFLVFALLSRGDRKKRALAAVSALAAGLHMVFGTYGIRYEPYIWAYLLLVALYLAGGRISALLGAGRIRVALRMTLVAGVFTALFSIHSLWWTCVLPLGANNIYEQQYQMHRFAAGYYKKPVAVNDIGYVAYKNPAYVIDLRGLASKEAFASRFSPDGRATNWMDDLAKAKGAGLAMIYEDWVPAPVPGNWIKLGELRLGKKRITVGGAAVSFFAVDEAARAEIVPELREFAKTLPEGAVFSKESCRDFLTVVGFPFPPGLPVRPKKEAKR